MNPLHDKVGALKAAVELIQAIDALTPGEYSAMFEKTPTAAEIDRVRNAVAPWREIVGNLQALAVKLEGLQESDLDIEMKRAAVAAAEQRLHEIGVSVAAKEERLALLLQEEDRIAAELTTRKRELATVEGALAEYRAKIAAL